MSERVETAIAEASRVQQEATTTSFEGFFEEQRADLFAALCLLTRNRHEAEEVMQDAFLKVWERWGRVSAMDKPDGYLYRTAMNLYRSRRRRTTVAIRRAVHLLPPDDGLARVLDNQQIAGELTKLTPRQRAAVVLMDLFDYSSEEAADILGVTPSTTRVLAHTGRKRLRETSADQGAHDD